MTDPVSPLTLEEAIAMAERMKDLAREDSDREEREGNEKASEYWEGFADALWTLLNHIKTGVKVTCFPVGSCTCHPFTVELRKAERGERFWEVWRDWYNRLAR